MGGRQDKGLQEVSVRALDVARLESLIGPERMARFEAAAEASQATLAGRMVLNVSSTATGGGVAEMLQNLLAYVRGAGIDARWVVIEGDRQFFTITKRIHNGLYGSPGDGGELGEAEQRRHDSVIRRNREQVLSHVRPGDLVLIHDPQPVGLLEAVKQVGARALWRCHVGSDRPNEWTGRAWEFLRPYLQEADGYVVSRQGFAPPWANGHATHVISPSIDPFSAKNEPMSHRNIEMTLRYVGLLNGDRTPPGVPFTRRDGSPGFIRNRVDVVQSGPSADVGAPLVVQASRWDRMKDMAGVMEGFARHVDRALGAHLVLAGPAVTGVADDPEAREVYDECVERWRRLPDEARARVHLACIPMNDPDENAAIVNALQRHASVVVQKSLAEGFGLTVTEAMWKSRPIVASAVGGISDQIAHGEQGLLIDNPDDLAAFGAAVERLLRDPVTAARLGAKARERALTSFLGDRHLDQYGRLVATLW